MKNTPHQNYRFAQISRLKAGEPMEYKPKIKITTEHGETKTLDITIAELEAIATILMTDTGE